MTHDLPLLLQLIWAGEQDDTCLAGKALADYLEETGLAALACDHNRWADPCVILRADDPYGLFGVNDHPPAGCPRRVNAAHQHLIDRGLIPGAGAGSVEFHFKIGRTVRDWEFSCPPYPVPDLAERARRIRGSFPYVHVRGSIKTRPRRAVWVGGPCCDSPLYREANRQALDDLGRWLVLRFPAHPRVLVDYPRESVDTDGEFDWYVTQSRERRWYTPSGRFRVSFFG
jgi:hypothetical protein